MQTVNEATCRYLLEGLAATPVVLAYLLDETGAEIWDRRPDPERFTIREVVAHLADWEAISLRRLERIRAEKDPLLPDIDEGELAKRNDYAHVAVGNGLRSFQRSRTQLLKMLAQLEPSEWVRIAHHETRGRLNIQDLATIVLGHDNYHLRQVTEWIESSG
jgi:hypothetical protein